MAEPSFDLPAADRLALLDDPGLPPIREFLADGEALWRAAGGEGGGSVRPVQVRWQPGRALTVRYAGAPGTAFVAEARHDGARAKGGPAVRVWPVAADPDLPGLAVALDPKRVRDLLAQLGVPRAGVALRLRAYRPRRRAVVEVETGAHRLFLKVVRPRTIARVQRVHESLRGALPVPATHGWLPELGLVVLEALPGITLREALRRGDPAPAAAGIERLLAGLLPPAGSSAARSQVQAGLRHLDLVRRLAPEASRAVEGFDPGELAGVSRVDAFIHGDLHEGQVLVEGGSLIGLLDLDTAGFGDPRDDWATLLAHLSVLASEAGSEERARFADYGAEVREILWRVSGDEQSRREAMARVAAVVLGLAAGPFAALTPGWGDLVDRRVRLAAGWLRAAAGDESGLIQVSQPSQVAGRT